MVRSMLPLLPSLTGGLGAWLLLGIKILTAMGSVVAANMIVLYAC